MTHAYSELYLSDAKKSLATMFDYAVHDCNYEIDWVVEIFLKSGYAKRFETGNPSVIGGMSGVELTRNIVYTVYNEDLVIEAVQPIDKSPEYWAGWALADYQWYSGYRFKDIFEKISMSEIVNMYHLFHEMDIRHFYDAMDKRMSQQTRDTNLKKIREASGLSQNELAKKSGVSLRSIQMYEQRRNNINNAQYNVLKAITDVLGCKVEEVLE